MNYPTTLALTLITILTLVACEPAGDAPCPLEDDRTEIAVVGPLDPAASMACDMFVVDVLVPVTNGWEAITIDAGPGRPGDVLRVLKTPDVWNLRCAVGEVVPWQGIRLNRTLLGTISSVETPSIPIPPPVETPAVEIATADRWVLVGPVDATMPNECEWMTASFWPADATSVYVEDIEAARPGDLISLPAGSQLVGLTCGWSSADGLGHEAPWSATRVE